MTFEPLHTSTAAELLKADPIPKSAFSQDVCHAAKKLLRTVQIRFPGLLDAKFAAMRGYRRTLRKPFESDFKALVHFRAMEGEYLDVGANRGQSTDAILMHNSYARVNLFEPNTILFGKLQRMFAGNPRLTQTSRVKGSVPVTPLAAYQTRQPAWQMAPAGSAPARGA